jgi:hypothetical protein
MSNTPDNGLVNHDNNGAWNPPINSCRVEPGTYYMLVYFRRESDSDGDTYQMDFEMTFTPDDSNSAFGEVQQVTTITESDYAGKATKPDPSAANEDQYQVAYLITFGDADKDYSIMIKNTSGSLPGEMVLCKSDHYKEWGMIPFSDLFATKGSMRSYIADHPYNRLMISEGRNYLGGEPYQFALSADIKRWVRIVPGGTYYILIARDNNDYSGSFTIDVKVQQVISFE